MSKVNELRFWLAWFFAAPFIASASIHFFSAWLSIPITFTCLLFWATAVREAPKLLKELKNDA